MLLLSLSLLLLYPYYSPTTPTSPTPTRPTLAPPSTPAQPLLLYSHFTISTTGRQRSFSNPIFPFSYSSSDSYISLPYTARCSWLVRLDIVLKAVLRYQRDAYKWELRNSEVQATFQVIYKDGCAYAHEPGENMSSSFYKGCLAWICSRDCIATALQQERYASLQLLWPLGSCALIMSSSSDNAKFKLDPKPDIPNLDQAIMLVFGHHQEAAWCWRILKRQQNCTAPIWQQLVGLDIRLPAEPATSSSEPSPEARR